jgi:hypothetical protein
VDLHTDIIQNLNQLSIDGNQISPGLGDILQYLTSSLGNKETLKPSAEPNSQPVSRPDPTAYQPGFMSKDAEYVFLTLLKTINTLSKKVECLQDQVQKLQNP